MPTRTLLVIAGIVLAIPIVLPLLVGTYTRRDPELAGIPFFFWYQFLLVIVSVAFTTVAYRLVIKHETERRAHERSEREGGVR